MKSKILLLLLWTITFASGQNLNDNAIKSSSNAIFLWNNNMPGGNGPSITERISDNGAITNVSRPRLIVYQPEKPNGTAILVISGGGYAHIELGKESTPTAQWLQSQGITVFELIYRLPQEGWTTADVPFQDAQRAMRIIRSKANDYKINPNKIGILGFSAGGHLAGFIATQFDLHLYDAVDEMDLVSAKPNFLGLIYAVISMLPPNNKTHTFKSILGTNPSLSQETLFSIEKQVKEDTPITFLAQALDDSISPIDNIFLMSNALRLNKINFEMHVFQSGGHGWGMGKPDSVVSAWSELFKKWAKLNGFWD